MGSEFLKRHGDRVRDASLGPSSGGMKTAFTVSTWRGPRSDFVRETASDEGACNRVSVLIPPMQHFVQL